MAIISISRTNHFLSRLVRVLEWYRLGQFLPWVVLAVSMAITYHLWKDKEKEVLLELSTDFNFRARETISNIEQRMKTYEHILRGVQGLFSASGSVDRNRFYAYVSTLQLEQNFSGIRGMGFSPVVLPAQKDDFVDAVRKEGLPGYAILPEGMREFYTPIVFIEPFSESNIRSLGLDSYAYPERRAAMEQSRDSDKAVITGKLLLQETDGHIRSGFLMFLPVYKSGIPHDTVPRRRANLLGWIYASSRIEELMTDVRGQAYTDLDVELHDGDSVSDETLMYDSDVSASHLASISQAQFRVASHLEVANHHWTIAAHSLPGFDFQLDSGKPQFIAYSGIGISILLTLLTWLLVYGRARALQDAEEITQSEIRYRQMFEDNASVAYLLDPDTGHIVDANAAALAFWGYSLEELLNMNISKISIVPSGKIVETMSKIKSSTTHRMEMHHRTKSGEIRDVEVFSGPLTYGGKNLRYSIAHDITARKRAEEALKLSSTVFNTVEDAVMVTDTDNKIILVNPAFTSVTGYTSVEVLGNNPRMLSSAKHPPEFFRKLWDALQIRGSWRGEIWNRRKNGEIYAQWLSIKVVSDEGGKITHYVAVFSDKGEIKPQ
jgi:PAS domain S-box-containing protein